MKLSSLISTPNLKVMTILGTRPEIIRLSRIMPLLDQFSEHIIVHTGQNYDDKLNKIFWDELDLRYPDYNLECATTSLGASIADIIQKIEPILTTEKPDVVVILGDTNSSLAAYMAKRMGIYIVHLEGGNRCFNAEVPEEINRRIIDHLADINLVYTEHARRNLLSEGIHSSRIFVIGSPMKEILDFYSDKILQSTILDTFNLSPQKYIIASIHREETVENPERLQNVINGLEYIAKTMHYPVLMSTHPRTRKKLEKLGLLDRYSKHIHFLEPFGLFDYILLQKNAWCVLSDSGTLSEEASILGFPGVIIRETTERPEAIDTGNVMVAGYDISEILNSVAITVEHHKLTTLKNSIPIEYTIENTSWRVLKHILGHKRNQNFS